MLKMNCPICRNVALKPDSLAIGLTSQHCPQCNGNWLNSYRLWEWLERQSAEGLPAPAQPPMDLPPVADTPGARLCPECQHILRKYRVGVGSGFALDRCGNCGGVWLDGGEWEALMGLGLHTQVAHIFSAAWQRSIAEAEKVRNWDRFYSERFGAEDFAELKRIKKWLSFHPKGGELLRYLSDPGF